MWEIIYIIILSHVKHVPIETNHSVLKPSLYIFFICKFVLLKSIFVCYDRFQILEDIQSVMIQHLLKTVCTEITNLVFNIYAADSMLALSDDKTMTQEVGPMSDL